MPYLDPLTSLVGPLMFRHAVWREVECEVEVEHKREGDGEGEGEGEGLFDLCYWQVRTCKLTG